MIWKGATQVGCNYVKSVPRTPATRALGPIWNDAEIEDGMVREGERIDGHRARRVPQNKSGRFWRKKSSGKYFVVCRFSPPGNYRNQYTKNVFPSLNFQE